MNKYKSKILNFNDGIISRLYHNLKWIFSFYKMYMGRILLYAFIEVLRLCVDFFITYKVGNVVDFALDKNQEKVLAMGIFYVFLFIANALFSISSNRLSAWNYNTMQSDMVKKLFNKVLVE